MEIDGYRMTIGWGKAIKKLTGNATANLGVQGGYLKPNNAALPVSRNITRVPLPLPLHLHLHLRVIVTHPPPVFPPSSLA